MILKILLLSCSHQSHTFFRRRRVPIIRHLKKLIDILHINVQFQTQSKYLTPRSSYFLSFKLYKVLKCCSLSTLIPSDWKISLGVPMTQLKSSMAPEFPLSLLGSFVPQELWCFSPPQTSWRLCSEVMLWSPTLAFTLCSMWFHTVKESQVRSWKWVYGLWKTEQFSNLRDSPLSRCLGLSFKRPLFSPSWASVAPQSAGSVLAGSKLDLAREWQPIGPWLKESQASHLDESRVPWMQGMRRGSWWREVDSSGNLASRFQHSGQFPHGP